jgi:chromosome segregation ATPase
MKRACLLIAVLAATHAGAAFKCVDERGITHVGDTPPPGCAKVVMYEINRSGQVLREIPPTLTPEQVKQKQAEDAKRREAERVAAEQKRKDTALLQTFSSEKEFDVVRDRNIEPLRSRIRNAQERIKAVDKRAKEVEEESEFYKAGKKGKAKGKGAEMPKQFGDELDRLKAEKATLTKSIASTEKEIEELREKFDVDKRRWARLKEGEGSAKAEPAPAPAPVAGKAAKK